MAKKCQRCGGRMPKNPKQLDVWVYDANEDKDADKMDLQAMVICKKCVSAINIEQWQKENNIKH